MRRLQWMLPGLAAALVVVLLPDRAFAWGPLAHLDFSSGALDHVASAPAALRMLLGKCGAEFLYGSLAADIVVGKNLARYAVHCHNWRTGWRVLGEAKGEPQKAVALGFLAHLAADTIAHNYYVPSKIVAGYAVRATGHAYWELRYDQRLDPSLWQLARRVTRPDHRRHDAFLQEALVGSYVIPFGVSRSMFGQLLVAARMKRWQGMSAMVAGERELLLRDEEIAEARTLAVGQIVSMLEHGESARPNGADPTGGRNLHLALQLRQSLREATRRRELSSEEASVVVERARAAFRAGIHGKVELPELPRSASRAAHRLVDAAVDEAARAPASAPTDDELARAG